MKEAERRFLKGGSRDAVERKTNVRPSLADKVAQIYYTHGVFCAGHPWTVIVITIAIVLICCIPLIKLPLPNNIPQVYKSKVSINSSLPLSTNIPKWFTSTEQDVVFIQQIILKSTVSPWKENMITTDAIRAPLAQAFRLLEIIQNFQHTKTKLSLSDFCFKVETPTFGIKTMSSPLPQFNCLVVSPANLWQQDLQRFHMDDNLITTIYNYNDIQMGKVSFSELLFGMQLKETGIKKYSVVNRQRVVQFAITLLLNKYDKDYLGSLRDHLINLYPLHQQNEKNLSKFDEILYLYYPGDFNFNEFLPLFFTYLALFLYIYFSVRKIELINFKVGMALSAVVTVISSLFMSIGLCLFFGLDPAGSSRGREILPVPYLVIIIGLENMLVLTKSVVSTPSHLDSKIRIAQGLSKEGWSITKNLLGEVTILTAGLLTLVPAIQEFCILAIVGLTCDFFLQMFFFSTVLSLDIRRSGNLEKIWPKKELSEKINFSKDYNNFYSETVATSTLTRSHSSPRLEYASGSSSQRSRSNNRNIKVKIPKRLRLIYFWARTRFVQRAFMVFMVAWIGGIVYNAGIVQHFIVTESNKVNFALPNHIFSKVTDKFSNLDATSILESNYSSNQKQSTILKNSHNGRPLLPVKWCYLVSAYNASTGPCKIAVSPPLRLKALISPSIALQLRNPREEAKFFKRRGTWGKLELAMDPPEMVVDEDQDDDDFPWEHQRTPFLPTSPLEVFLVTSLCVISTVVTGYAALALYHCVCSRNYEQWRSQFSSNNATENEMTTQIVEAIPLVLEGHLSSIEWITTDGLTISSTDLIGDVIIWDSYTGDKIAHINRRKYFDANKKEDFNMPDLEVLSDYESGSPPPSQTEFLNRLNFDEFDKSRVKNWSFPDLTPTINTKFSELKDLSKSSESVDYSINGYDFGSKINGMYNEFTDLQATMELDDHDVGSFDSLDNDIHCPQIWCTDCQNNLLALGTGQGRIEFWQPSNGQFKCIFDDSSNVGITAIKLINNKVVIARLTGNLELFTLEWGNPPNSSTYRRSHHVRSGSVGRAEDLNYLANFNYDLRCVRNNIIKAHQQPITDLQVGAGKILTSSHDHTLKVYSVHDLVLMFTLHGHYGPITAAFIDSFNPLTAGSGSQDGMLCVWDLLTGACVFGVDAHDGQIIKLTYSPSYVISMGIDERICVWDRFQGHLLNTILINLTYCSSMAMLTSNLLITANKGFLIIWDVQEGTEMKQIKLGGHFDQFLFVNSIIPIRDTIICDYGNQLRIVKFPLVISEKKIV